MLAARTNIGNISFPCAYKKIGPRGYCTCLIKFLPVSELVSSLGRLLLGPAAGESELKALAVRHGRLKLKMAFPSLRQENIVIKPFCSVWFPHGHFIILKCAQLTLVFMMANASAVVTDSVMKKVLAILLKSQWAFRGSPLMVVWAESGSLL